MCVCIHVSLHTYPHKDLTYYTHQHHQDSKPSQDLHSSPDKVFLFFIS